MESLWNKDTHKGKKIIGKLLSKGGGCSAVFFSSKYKYSLCVCVCQKFSTETTWKGWSRCKGEHKWVWTLKPSTSWLCDPGLGPSSLWGPLSHLKNRNTNTAFLFLYEVLEDQITKHLTVFCTLANTICLVFISMLVKLYQRWVYGYTEQSDWILSNSSIWICA